MTDIPEDIMAIANEIVDRIAKVHSWKGDCVADVAQAILAERNSRAAERDRLREENERLRKALEFYANPGIYKPHPHGPAFDWRDLSYHARAALSPVEESK